MRQCSFKSIFKSIFKNIIFVIALSCLALFGVLFCKSEAYAVPPTVKINPVDGKVEVGTLTLFTAIPTIDPATTINPTSYKWWFDNVPFPSCDELFICSNNTLTVGSHSIKVTVLDKTDQPGEGDATITVTPKVEIISPKANDFYSVGETITFEGKATDADGNSVAGLTLKWKDGVADLETGSPLKLSNLKAGEHKITLEVRDSSDKVLIISESITITVNELTSNTPPKAEIISPQADDSYDFGKPVDFEGTGTDTQDITLSGASLVWSSDKDGNIGLGVSFTTTKLSVNTHVITLTATDSGGLTDSKHITITIGNTPKVEIISPKANDFYSVGETITFEGKATDADGNSVAGLTLKWKDGVADLETGSPLKLSNLKAGEHKITLEVRDSSDKVLIISESITITVNELTSNTPPKAEIISPQADDSYDFGKPVDFEGTGTDTEDITLSGASLVWSSDKDGNIGSGASFTTTKLSVNTHRITLTATDRGGLTDNKYITITIVDSSSIALIASPADNSSHAFGTSITFSGTGKDSAGVPLTGNSLKWESDINGFLGTGDPLVISTLSLGSHVITLTATDSTGAKGTDDITITVSRNASPVATITSPKTDAKFDFGKPVVFEGTGTDTEDSTLSGASLVWSSDKDGKIGSGASFTTTKLSVNTHVITLTATDSGGLTDSKQIVITVQDTKNTSPTAEITSPKATDSIVYDFGKPVVFEGTGTDTEDSTLSGASLVWSSDKDGKIGSGASFTTTNLSVNTHVITLTVTDSGGLTNSKQIVITIKSALVATITSPKATDSRVYDFGKPVVFEGTGTDAKGVRLTGSNLKWTSDKDGEIGSGESFSTNKLSTNTHTITLTVTDSGGLTDSKYITITIGNSSPIALITSPDNNSNYGVGKPIIFSGTGTDTEDGQLTGNSLKWESDIDGVLGYGQSITQSDLSVNTTEKPNHKITLTATDSKGLTGTSTITITIGNSSPIAIITSPNNNSSYDLGKPITFSGTGTDTEDGQLTGNSLKWESDIDGVLGYGQSITQSDLSVNTTEKPNHKITLTATDSKGLTGTITITITIGNALPVATITKPADNSSHVFGKLIEFKGTGSDAEDGSITGNSLKWESDKGGFLGYGESVSLDNLSVGTHIIKLTVTDTTDLIGTDTITINITNTPPKVSIITPSSGAMFNLNEFIEFNGEATDSEDGELTGSSLVWTSNRKDAPTPLGTGGQISVNSLAIGQHLITLTATDKSTPSLSATSSIIITVGSEALPTVSILTPVDGSKFYLNDYIEFTGEAFDNTDDKSIELKAESLVWTSNIQTLSLVNGNLGTGNILKLNTLSLGEHLITLTATSGNEVAGIKVAGIDFIVITVGNHLPVPIIDSPNNNNVFDEGEIINFSGYATDIEDGDLSGSALAWTSDIDGYLGNGVKFSKALSQGEHTISLTAKDNDGGVCDEPAKISLTINPTEQSLPMTLENMDVSLPLGQTGEFTITGGHPPYRYYRDYPLIASMNIIGKKMKIIPKSMGNTTFQIVDHYNTTKVLSLTVTDSLDNVPLANAGYDQDVVEGTGVVLDGTSSFKGNNGIASWSWSQVVDENSISGNSVISNSDNTKKVVLSDSSSPKAMFVAPALSDVSSGLPNSVLKLTFRLTFRLTVADKDGNKSSDDIDVNVSDNGIAGYPQGVTTFYTIDRLNNLGIKVVGDGELVYLNPEAPEFIKETINRPENMLYGLVDLKIKVEPGESANMIVYFPKRLSEEFSGYKYGVVNGTGITNETGTTENGNTAKGWYSYSDHITFSSDRTKAYLVLTDGGQGDDDGVADGIISDPIAFGTKSKTPSIPDTPSGDSGGGGGCFISTLFE